METPIADFVSRYAKSGTARLHMPGHKGAARLGCEPLDITEIRGADELYAADGIIAESERNAAALFGTGATYYSAEGSSQCIRAMLYLAMTRAPKKTYVLAARNVHKAFVYACALLDIRAEWLWPEDGTDSLCRCRVSPEQLARALDAAAEQPFAVYVTSPDYLGGTQDIAGLAKVCREHGVPLLADNAHGAYLRFLEEDRHPITLGAAMCCDSAHKTLPALTGAAYLHLSRDFPVPPETARGAMCLFGSTSPSYLILQSLDLCNAELAGSFPARLRECVRRASETRKALNAIADGLCAECDEPLKLTLDARAVGRSGEALADALRLGGVECEYADRRYAVLMVSPDTSEEDLRRVLKAIPVSGHTAETDDTAELFAELRTELTRGMTIREAVLAPQETIPAGEALGRVCAMPSVSCPPAIPIAVSGEVITPAAVKLMRRYGIGKVAVVKEK